MMHVTLVCGCGPYFNPEGLWVSLVLFLAIKPLAYFAFIQAFRYRVNRGVPMRFGQALWLTALRAVLGIVLVGIGAAFLWMIQAPAELIALSWVYLYGERLFSWWYVGSRGAGLVGRRLIGWIISGTAINAAFDVAMVWGLIEGWPPQLGITAAIAIFIATLHVIGRRPALKMRFADGQYCASCRYDLTGNLSGRCPECGTSVAVFAGS